MADVFVSYARGDQHKAELIAKRLSEAGFTVWWDTDLLPHNSFSTVIEEEIRTARAVLVIWSSTACQSQWVRAEAELGRGEGKLIQVFIDDSPIPLPFNQYQAADLRRWRGNAAAPQWRKVLASVGHFTGTSEENQQPPKGSGSPSDRHSPSRRRTMRRAVAAACAGIAVVAAVGGLFLW